MNPILTMAAMLGISTPGNNAREKTRTKRRKNPMHGLVGSGDFIISKHRKL